MKLPRFDDVEFSPLAWKEWLLYGDKSEFRSKRDIFKYLNKWNEEGYFEGCSGIKNYFRNRQIRRLLNGYAIIDLLDCFSTVEWIRFPVWRLFEDFVGEILKIVLTEKHECTVAYVDRWPGFQGLDYIIINSKSKHGWKVGIQCKRFIGTRRSYRKISECSSWTRGTSAAGLYYKGEETRDRFPEKKIVLVTFSAYRRNKSQEKRFNNLSEVWDSVMVFDDNLSDELPYTYKLRCDELDKIVRWC